MKTKDRIGEKNINNGQNLEMEIVGYRRNDDIDVKFIASGFVVRTAYKEFKRGSVKDKLSPSVHGVGTVGIGHPTVDENGKNTKQYLVWYSMINRVHEANVLCRTDKTAWVGVDIDERFLNFQYFFEWYNENIWSYDCMVLDKDILLKGNKVYSPNTCILVDTRLNSLFTKTTRSRGLYPIGVYYKKDCGKYRAQCSMITEKGKRQKYLGEYDTPQEAFEVYKEFKENYIKQVADEYKEKYPKFPQKLYEAMYNYEIRIDD